MHKIEDLDMRVGEAQSAAGDAIANQDRLDRAIRIQVDLIKGLSRSINYLEKKNNERGQMERMRIKF